MRKYTNSACIRDVRKNILRGKTEPLSLPTWVADAFRTDDNFNVLPDGSVERQSAAEVDAQIQKMYDDSSKNGYLFPWGYISETFIEIAPGSDDDGTCIVFSFFLNELTKSFPFPIEISELMNSMYSVHRLRHSEFDFGYGYDGWDVFQIDAFDKQNIIDLRRWLVEIFLPEIFPDMYFAARRLFTSN